MVNCKRCEYWDASRLRKDKTAPCTYLRKIKSINIEQLRPAKEWCSFGKEKK